ncbi:hypothetical protein BC834DRAFT_599782 [Gloeopeniophorella convolvens]|nr:hypothetical protein BC834DRAFT_599782 [Gloeopeniophorella convolvens]
MRRDVGLAIRHRWIHAAFPEAPSQSRPSAPQPDNCTHPFTYSGILSVPAPNLSARMSWIYCQTPEAQHSNTPLFVRGGASIQTHRAYLGSSYNASNQFRVRLRPTPDSFCQPSVNLNQLPSVLGQVRVVSPAQAWRLVLSDEPQPLSISTMRSFLKTSFVILALSVFVAASPFDMKGRAEGAVLFLVAGSLFAHACNRVAFARSPNEGGFTTIKD